ncbi:MAG: DNA-binding protein [Nitrospirae bacterium]|nr:DNA-binding protein [Nitrospirota bacterium]
MKYSEGKIGRIFVIRLEDGDKLPDVIELLAREKNISRGLCILVGGIKDGGNIVAGPKDSESTPIVPMVFKLKGVHEIVAAGAIFPDSNGQPRLHMHAALGREEKTRTGCIRPGIEVWKLGEVILLEIIDNNAYRAEDSDTGFESLRP